MYSYILHKYLDYANEFIYLDWLSYLRTIHTYVFIIIFKRKFRYDAYNIQNEDSETHGALYVALNTFTAAIASHFGQVDSSTSTCTVFHTHANPFCRPSGTKERKKYKGVHTKYKYAKEGSQMHPEARGASSNPKSDCREFHPNLEWLCSYCYEPLALS